jgi:hypothetical protein
VIGVMNGSFRVAGSTSARLRATSIATERIESVRGEVYEDITVNTPLGPTTTSTRDFGNVRYNIEESVDWVMETGGPPPPPKTTGDYKRVTVQVSWTDESGFHAVHQTSSVYPGGLGPDNVGGSVDAVGPGSPASPDNLVATVPPGAAGTTGVALTWTPPVSTEPPVTHYIVEMSTDAAFTSASKIGDVESSYLYVTGLASDTTYHFRVASVAANDEVSTTWATAYNVHTTPPVAPTLLCKVGLATVSPDAVSKKATPNAGGKLVANPVVSVNLSGPCDSTVLRMEYEPRSGYPITQVLGNDVNGGAQVRTGFVDGDKAWSAGWHEIRILEGNTERASTLLLVCDSRRPKCRQ